MPWALLIGVEGEEPVLLPLLLAPGPPVRAGTAHLQDKVPHGRQQA